MKNNRVAIALVTAALTTFALTSCKGMPPPPDPMQPAQTEERPPPPSFSHPETPQVFPIPKPA